MESTPQEYCNHKNITDPKSHHIPTGKGTPSIPPPKPHQHVKEKIIVYLYSPIIFNQMNAKVEQLVYSEITIQLQLHRQRKNRLNATL